MSKVSEKTKSGDDDKLYYGAAIILAIAAFYIFVQSNLTDPLIPFEDTKYNGLGSNSYKFVCDEKKVLSSSSYSSGKICLHDSKTGKVILWRPSWKIEGLYKDRYLLINKETGDHGLTWSVVDLVNLKSLAVNTRDADYLLNHGDLSRLFNGDESVSCSERFYFYNFKYYYRILWKNEGDRHLTVSIHTAADDTELLSFPFERKLLDYHHVLKSRRYSFVLWIDDAAAVSFNTEDGQALIHETGKHVAVDVKKVPNQIKIKSSPVKVTDFLPPSKWKRNEPHKLANEFVDGCNINDLSKDGQFYLCAGFGENSIDGIYKRAHVRQKMYIGMVRYYLFHGILMLFIIYCVATHHYGVVKTTTTRDQDGNLVKVETEIYH